jgi:surface antigen
MVRNCVAVLAVSMMLGGCSGQLYGTGPLGLPAQQKHAHATIQAAEGKETAWSIEKGTGSVAPAGAQFADRGGRPCRPLKQNVALNGDQMTRDVTACKALDGTWVVTDFEIEKAD